MPEIAKTSRMPRVNELLRREIADIVEKNYASSFKCLVTVSEVKASPDLREAKVFISVFGGKAQDKHKAFLLLNEKRGEIQRHISKDVILKYTPVLHFFNDERMEKADKVLQIISELEVEK